MKTNNRNRLPLSRNERLAAYPDVLDIVVTMILCALFLLVLSTLVQGASITGKETPFKTLENPAVPSPLPDELTGCRRRGVFPDRIAAVLAVRKRY